ncbi:MAG: 2-C-methyl-D-erythritol 4-phosphate cytidylyltransferase [Actinomycetota bacterium]
MRAAGVIVAAGRGERLGMDVPKAFARVAGKPMLDWSLGAMRSVFGDDLVVVLPPDAARARIDAMVVDGGATRQESVRRSLDRVSGFDAVVVHDAARPCVTTQLIECVLAALADADAVICAVPVADTLKRADGTTVAREGLLRAQTPQAFRLDALRRAHERAAAEGFEATDDAQLVERYGGTIAIVPGDEHNIKVTTKEDIAVAEALLSEPHGRSGIGYDAHAFTDGRALVLGCVTIPGARGLAGHSDADVLSHAIVDALLGAAALGDIGEHFPSSDQRWEGAPSAEFLRAASSMLADAGLVIASVDATVVMERPAIAPYRDEMRKRLADALGIDVERVSVKATTTDRVGSIGREEGAAATAVVRVTPR